MFSYFLRTNHLIILSVFESLFINCLFLSVMVTSFDSGCLRRVREEDEEDPRPQSEVHLWGITLNEERVID